MDRSRAHAGTSVRGGSGQKRSIWKRDMKTEQHQGQLQLKRAVVFLVALTVQPQVVCAGGLFELQIRHFQNPHGLLQNGECCDLQTSGGQRCSSRDQCDTFFRACLKEYQARVASTGACTFGVGYSGILGGNSHSPHHLRHSEGGGGGEGEDGTNGHIVIPFSYAWPKSFSLVLEALDSDNDTLETGQLIERVLLSSMLNPGEQWQPYRHHGQSLSVEYWLRFRCDSNYFGPFCNKFCRARDDFVGHFSCDPSGTKVCIKGWTGPECKEAVCRQGCHQTHGFCTVPGECECHYGWRGSLCDQCVTYPGCAHGSCTEPWRCVCDVNWGGLLCDKDLNFCGTHTPCKNGGTCTNTEPNEYQCECPEGFRGRNCDIVDHACLSSPCMNGATCVEDLEGFSCVCAEGWTGHTCSEVVKHCDRNPCRHGATCQDVPEGFRCLCPPQWTGRTCQLDTNECEKGICVNARSCRNLIGGYLCDCRPGWTGHNCDIRMSTCQGLCLNGGQCEDQVSGSKCLCPPGYSGKFCQNSPSPCDSAPCLNGGLCQDKDGQTATCSCAVGFSGSLCEVALDLCDPNPCQQGVECHRVEGRYMCACPNGSHGRECVSFRSPCVGQNCQGAVSDTTNGSLSFYMILVGVLALVTVCGCAACAFIFSHLHRMRKKQQADAPQEEGINNQRELVNLIRNVDRPVPLPPPTAPLTQPPPPTPCYEEIELTLPPSPALSQASPALKPAHAPKLDISNREREKLNRFNQTDNQELEV